MTGPRRVPRIPTSRCVPWDIEYLDTLADLGTLDPRSGTTVARCTRCGTTWHITPRAQGGTGQTVRTRNGGCT
jgi:hypothetical protein